MIDQRSIDRDKPHAFERALREEEAIERVARRRRRLDPRQDVRGENRNDRKIAGRGRTRKGSIHEQRLKGRPRSAKRLPPASPPKGHHARRGRIKLPRGLSRRGMALSRDGRAGVNALPSQ